MELLDRIAELSGCQYISDLKCNIMWKLILKQMPREEIHRYTLEEWRKVMNYLSKKRQEGIEQYESIEEWIRKL